MFYKTLTFLMTSLNFLPKSGKKLFIYIMRELFILNLLVSYVCSFDVCGSDSRLNVRQKINIKKKELLSFILRFALITALTRYGQTHTNAQMSPAGCTCQNVWRDKKWWKAQCSNKGKVPLAMRELFGLCEKESDETFEYKKCQTKPEKLWPTKTGAYHKIYISDTTIPQIWKAAKYSCTTWLISITSLPDILPVNCLTSLSGVCIICLWQNMLWYTNTSQSDISSHWYTYGTTGPHTRSRSTRGHTTERRE